MIKGTSMWQKLRFLHLTFACILFGVSHCYAIGNFNGVDGDGKKRDEIITFIRDSKIGSGRGDVYVALSNGLSFGKGMKWHDFFCLSNEIPAVGDFNGDGRDDIVTFIRDTKSGGGRWDVYVALSTGSSFGKGMKWHNYFCVGNEIPAVGDFNGDGKDDIITFVRDTKSGSERGDVWVALSTGSSFGQGMKWHNFFCVGNEIPAVGDFNGDGKDDLVTFVRDTKSGGERGDVWVTLSNGSSFGKGMKWHNYFCISNEIPAVGDFNGDGKDDIVTFVRDTKSGGERGDVWVALSTGASFGKGMKWHDYFSVSNEIPAVGDFNGDGEDDLVTFVHETKSGGERGDVWVTLSNGSSFGPGMKWHGYFSVLDEVPTTFAAVMPYYMFAKSYEDQDSQFVGYASNEEERFWDNVWDFKDEFENTWPCTQYYWGERRFLQENHLKFVDSADLAYVSGHGSSSYIALSKGEGCGLTNSSWGSWSSNSRKGDLEYIAFESCSVLSLSGNWWERWRSTPNKKGPFSGLHLACGFTNKHKESPVFELSDEFAENLEDGFCVRWAWLEATDDEDDWVWFHNNIGCVIYLKPHKYETIWGHKAKDRWYHDSDYKIYAEYWVY
ncbi:MAG: FG-GAP-like repeat-containing protein [Candidatus Heimdallarchaeota archaeon]